MSKQRTPGRCSAKRFLTLTFSFALVLFTAACGQQPASDPIQNPPSNPSPASVSSREEPPAPEVSEGSQTEEPQTDSGPHVLIAYFSQYAFLANNARAVDGVSSASVAPGDVERIAGMIQETTGGDLFPITAAEPYPSDYDEVAQRSREEAGTRPPLADLVEELTQYDTIFVGYPVWAGTYPMPVATFLENYDLSGKTVIPFCTYENYITEDVWAQIETIAPGAEVKEGYAISLLYERPSAEGISEWLTGLDIYGSAVD